MGKKKHKQKKRKEKSRVPLHDTHQAVHFFVFLYFRGGRRNRKQREEDNELHFPSDVGVWLFCKELNLCVKFVSPSFCKELMPVKPTQH